MRKDTDIAQLFQNICSEDCERSYDTLFAALFPRLVHFSATIIGSFSMAEEVVSDVFLMVWQKRTQLTEVQHPRSYLYVCTRNRSLNALSQKKDFIAFDTLDRDALAVAPSVENRMVSNEVKKLLEKAIDDLPNRCRLIFRLIRIDGLSYKEVALLLHISTKTVDAQLAIAVKKLSLAVKLTIPGELAHAYLEAN